MPGLRSAIHLCGVWTALVIALTVGIIGTNVLVLVATIVPLPHVLPARLIMIVFLLLEGLWTALRVLFGASILGAVHMVDAPVPGGTASLRVTYFDQHGNILGYESFDTPTA